MSPLTAKEQYQADLLTPWWKAYRKAVLHIFGEKCNRCGSKYMVQIHHKRYIPGFKPWQYKDPNDIEVLCRYCHMKEHGIEVPSADVFSLRHIRTYLIDFLG